MTIEEMVQFCENGADWYNRTGPTAEKFEALAAALRAGQAINLCIELNKTRSGYNPYIIPSYETELAEAIKAWDAATATHSELGLKIIEGLEEAKELYEAKASTSEGGDHE